MKRIHCVVAIATCVVAFELGKAPHAQAQLITPTSLTVNAGVEFFPAINLINNSGLSATPNLGNYTTVTHAAASATTSWTTDDPNGGTGDYFDPLGVNPQMVMTLDSTYTLTGVVTWGYHFGSANRNEAKAFTLEFSTDGGSTYPTMVDVTKPNTIAAADTQLFGDAFMANTVRVTFTDNFFGEGAGGGGDRVGLGEIKFLGNNLGFHAEINRATGAMIIRNDSATPSVFAGIDVTSAAGSLNPTGWLSIAANYDSNDGGEVDPNDVWQEASRTPTNLAELTLGTATLASGQSINYGNAWQKSPFEDVNIEVLLSDGTTAGLPIEYVGNNDAPFEIGDLNFDGQLTGADWVVYRGGYGQPLGQLSQSQAYALGDLNSDGVNNVTDFSLFKTAYDAANGVGAFEAMVAAVPEPASWTLLALGAVLLGRKGVCRRGVSAVVALVMTAALASSSHATLLGHWTFENSGNLGLDSAGGDHNGTGGEDAAYSVNSAVGVGALKLTGLGTGLQVANSATFQPLTTFTIAAFVSADFTSPNYVNVGRPFSSLRQPTGEGTPNGYGFGVLESGGLRYTTYGIQDYDQPATVQANVWTHVAVVVTSGTAEFYVDGASVGTIAGGNPTATIDSFHIGAGAISATDAFVGLIDELRVYDEALSASAIATLADAFDPARLTLEVNTTTGATRIFNGTGVGFSIDHYEITSPGGSLSAGSWSSLQNNPVAGFPAGNGTGNGWERLGTPDADLLAEAFLTGSSAFGNGLSLNLGAAYNAAVNAQDLEFTYRLPSGDVLTGDVAYVSGGFLAADFNNSGTVDAADLALWKSGFGDVTATKIDGDADGDLDVDGNDFLIWQRQLGQSSSATPAGAPVPEPGSFTLVAVGAALLGQLRRVRRAAANERAGARRSTRTIATIAVAIAALGASATARAAVTLDRDYRLGEGAGENGANNAVVGSGHSIPGAGDTLDEQGPSGAYLDLTQLGNPVYANTQALARPGAAAGELGVRFDGVDDLLQGTPLNVPEEMAANLGAYPLNYTGIPFRGLQMWVYPDSAGLAAGAYQGIVMDSIMSGGPAITASGLWTQSNSQHVDGGGGIAGVPATVPVVGNTWHHVMHHIYANGSAGAPLLVPGTTDVRNATSVVYVNGVAVSSNNDTVAAGSLAVGPRVGALTVGANEMIGDGISPVFGNYFRGVVDDLEMYVYGNNSAQGGQNFGTFDLFADNDWIANRIATTVPGGVLKGGDVDRDGDVDNADVTAFIAGWKREKRLQGAHSAATVGDWETWGWGDMNHDGIVNLSDWHVLRTNHPGGAALNLGELLAVPEPGALPLVLAALAGVRIAAGRARRAKPATPPA